MPAPIASSQLQYSPRLHPELESATPPTGARQPAGASTFETRQAAAAAGSHDAGAAAETGRGRRSFRDPLTSRGDGAEPCTEAIYRSTSALLRLIAPPTGLPERGKADSRARSSHCLQELSA